MMLFQKLRWGRVHEEWDHGVILIRKGKTIGIKKIDVINYNENEKYKYQQIFYYLFPTVIHGRFCFMYWD